jgi:hypothetical protein
MSAPILNVIPRVCVDGYEDTGQKRPVKGTQEELYRYIGNVCWGVINVLPKVQAKPDKGDKVPAGSLAVP